MCQNRFILSQKLPCNLIHILHNIMHNYLANMRLKATYEDILGKFKIRGRYKKNLIKYIS